MVYMQKQTNKLKHVYYYYYRLYIILYPLINGNDTVQTNDKTDKSLGILLLSSLAPYVLLISHQVLQLLQ